MNFLHNQKRTDEKWNENYNKNYYTGSSYWENRHEKTSPGVFYQLKNFFFSKYRPTINPLVEVWNNTKDHFEKLPKPAKSIKYTDITKLSDYDNTIFLQKKRNLKNKINAQKGKPLLLPEVLPLANFEITDCDTLVMAQKFVEEGLNPLVLNLANAYTPGGGTRVGAKAQEEEIFRRSNAHLTHEAQMYPLTTYQTIYSPEVTVIKDTENKLLNKPFKISVYAVAAIMGPKLVKNTDGISVYNESDKRIMRAKIESIFKVAIQHKHDSLVLGALGCGVFNNPSWGVAPIFKEMCKKYASYFKKIGFAILVLSDKDEWTFDFFNFYINDVPFPSSKDSDNESEPTAETPKNLPVLYVPQNVPQNPFVQSYSHYLDDYSENPNKRNAYEYQEHQGYSDENGNRHMEKNTNVWEHFC